MTRTSKKAERRLRPGPEGRYPWVSKPQYQFAESLVRQHEIRGQVKLPRPEVALPKLLVVIEWAEGEIAKGLFRMAWGRPKTVPDSGKLLCEIGLGKLRGRSATLEGLRDRAVPAMQRQTALFNADDILVRGEKVKTGSVLDYCIKGILAEFRQLCVDIIAVDVRNLDEATKDQIRRGTAPQWVRDKNDLIMRVVLSRQAQIDVWERRAREKGDVIATAIYAAADALEGGPYRAPPPVTNKELDPGKVVPGPPVAGAGGGVRQQIRAQVGDQQITPGALPPVDQSAPQSGTPTPRQSYGPEFWRDLPTPTAEQLMPGGDRPATRPEPRPAEPRVDNAPPRIAQPNQPPSDTSTKPPQNLRDSVAAYLDTAYKSSTTNQRVIVSLARSEYFPKLLALRESMVSQGFSYTDTDDLLFRIDRVILADGRDRALDEAASWLRNRRIRSSH